MNESPKKENSLVISYLALRKTIGVLGILLPFVLALGAIIIFHMSLQSSISYYYYTGMRDVFVGTLFAIGFFLFSYKGYERADDIAGHVACISAVGMALFPTRPGPDDEGIIGYIHFALAALLFLTLIYFSFVLFTKTDPDREPTRRKLQRNRIYRACGWTMSACILLIVLFFVLPDGVASPIEQYDPVFWLEAIMVVAFGFSWLTKGEAILKDEA